MLRTLLRAASSFVVAGLLLMPLANASPVTLASPVGRGVIHAIEPALPVNSLPSANTSAASQPGSSAAHTIHLKSGDLTPDAPDVSALNQLTRSDGGRVHVLLQLDFIPRDQAKAEFEKNGVNLLAYVPDYAWIASVPASNPATVLDLTGVTWAGPLALNHKLDPMIQSGEWGSWNLAPDGTAAVTVVMQRDESIETGRALVEKHGGQIVGEVRGIRTLMVEMPAAAVAALAAEDAIQWIEAAEPALREANDGIRQQIGVNTVQAAPYNLSGSGVDILIYDGGIVTATHADFAGRITVPDVASVSDHSTHVAGTAAGSGSLSAANGGTALQWRGMAPGADIISYAYEWNGQGMLFYNNPGDIEADWAAAQNTYGADVGNASLGSNIYANYPLSCTLMGNYGVTSVLMDQIIR
ncbi:MAG TPA: S8 family serine peptidase, partial [Anaerolineae bacterium]|nr:S8 family serine peptidase [Anaerolineae bacterium]